MQCSSVRLAVSTSESQEPYGKAVTTSFLPVMNLLPADGAPRPRLEPLPPVPGDQYRPGPMNVKKVAADVKALESS